MEQRPINSIKSDLIAVDRTVDSSDEVSSGSSNPQVGRESTPVTERPQMSSGLLPVKLLRHLAFHTQLPNTN